MHYNDHENLERAKIVGLGSIAPIAICLFIFEFSFRGFLAGCLLALPGWIYWVSEAVDLELERFRKIDKIASEAYWKLADVEDALKRVSLPDAVSPAIVEVLEALDEMKHIALRTPPSSDS
jgi:hypothetical protein